eukprot:scaffold190764_cov36-Tisochrysis_lutea.AAC.3
MPSLKVDEGARDPQHLQREQYKPGEAKNIALPCACIAKKTHHAALRPAAKGYKKRMRRTLHFETEPRAAATSACLGVPAVDLRDLDAREIICCRLRCF